MSHGNVPMPCVTLAPGNCLLLRYLSINHFTAHNGKASSKKQSNLPRYDRSQNPPISSKYDIV